MFTFAKILLFFFNKSQHIIHIKYPGMFTTAAQIGEEVISQPSADTKPKFSSECALPRNPKIHNPLLLYGQHWGRALNIFNRESY